MFSHEMVLVFRFLQVLNKKHIAKETSVFYTSKNGENKSILTLSQCLGLRSVVIKVSFVINSESSCLIGDVQQINTTQDKPSSKQASSYVQLFLRQLALVYQVNACQ